MRSPKQRRKMIRLNPYQQRALTIARKSAEKGTAPLPKGYSFVPGRSEDFVLMPAGRGRK